MQDFRTLKVREKAHALTLDTYRATRDFPADEQYGLTSQLRRATASIPTNIAEGCGRGTNNEWARFIQIAQGSASEVHYHLLLAHDLGDLADSDHQRLETSIIEGKRMLVGFLKTLRNT